MHRLPISNLTKSRILPEARSNLIVSLACSSQEKHKKRKKYREKKEISIAGGSDLDERIRVAHSAPIVSHDVGDGGGLSLEEGVAALAGLLGAHDAKNTAQLVFGLFGGDAVKSETSFDVVQQAEAFVRLLDADDI